MKKERKSRSQEKAETISLHLFATIQSVIKNRDEEFYIWYVKTMCEKYYLTV
jgi:hypothetical protein